MVVAAKPNDFSSRFIPKAVTITSFKVLASSFKITSILLRLPTANSCVEKPIADTTRIAFSVFILILKAPLLSVTVPVLVPCT